MHLLLRHFGYGSAAGLAVGAILCLWVHFGWQGQTDFDLGRDGLLFASFMLAMGLFVGTVTAALAWHWRRSAQEMEQRLRVFLAGPKQDAELVATADTALGQLPALLAELTGRHRQALTQVDALRRQLLDHKEHLKSQRGRHQRQLGRMRGSMLAKFGPDLRWQGLTGTLARFLGRSARSLAGTALEALLHPKDLEPVRRAFAKVHSSGIVRKLPCRIARLPGSSQAPQWWIVLLIIKGRTPDAGGPFQFHSRWKDINHQTRAEWALRRQTQDMQRTNDKLRRINRSLERLKESYRDLYHNAPVMYFSLDPAGKLVTFNDTLLRTLGFGRDELLGQSYSRLLPADAGAAWERQLADPAKAEHALARDQENESRWRRRDGRVVPVWIRSAPLRDDQGKFVRSRSAALDLTEINRLANELRARGDELERTNERLRRINSELEDFTHVVSHDLKEPLRTLQAFSHILAEEFSKQLGADGFQYINHLVQASRRLGQLIDDLLTLSQAGRITSVVGPFDLHEAVATVRRDLADLLQRKEAMLLTEGSLTTVIGDRPRITQLLTNLVANGLKYNRSPHPVVVIGQGAPAALPFPVAAHHGVFFVRDNGIGIEARHHEQIFGIFRRLHQAEEYEGTGAGLAICKKIVEAHGGRIWVESQPDQGATFYFTLPTRPWTKVLVTGGSPQAESSSDEVPPSPTLNGFADPLPPASVVLVEDMQEMGAIIQKLASRSRLQVTWFTTAEDAWEHLQTREPDLLLLDINLPGMSGVELCQRVRRRQRNLTIVLFSQETDPEEIAGLRRAGADYVLSKDLLGQPPLWQQRIHDILNSRQATSKANGRQ